MNYVITFYISKVAGTNTASAILEHCSIKSEGYAMPRLSQVKSDVYVMNANSVIHGIGDNVG